MQLIEAIEIITKMKEKEIPSKNDPMNHYWIGYIDGLLAHESPFNEAPKALNNYIENFKDVLNKYASS